MKFSFFILLLFLTSICFGQARLDIVNNSDRYLYIKVMNKSSGLYSKLSVSPNGLETQFFTETGYFYLKTKSTARGKKPLFKKGSPFKVYNESDGYSVLTITYSIQGGTSAEGSGISEEEFEKNSK